MSYDDDWRESSNGNYWLIDGDDKRRVVYKKRNNLWSGMIGNRLMQKQLDSPTEAMQELDKEDFDSLSWRTPWDTTKSGGLTCRHGFVGIHVKQSKFPPKPWKVIIDRSYQPENFDTLEQARKWAEKHMRKWEAENHEDKVRS